MHNEWNTSLSFMFCFFFFLTSTVVSKYGISVSISGIWFKIIKISDIGIGWEFQIGTALVQSHAGTKLYKVTLEPDCTVMLEPDWSESCWNQTGQSYAGTKLVRVMLEPSWSELHWNQTIQSHTGTRLYSHAGTRLVRVILEPDWSELCWNQAG